MENMYFSLYRDILQPDTILILFTQMSILLIMPCILMSTLMHVCYFSDLRERRTVYMKTATKYKLVVYKIMSKNIVH